MANRLILVFVWPGLSAVFGSVEMTVSFYFHVSGFGHLFIQLETWFFLLDLRSLVPLRYSKNMS